MLFLVAGLLVDYSWPGVGLLVSGFYLAKLRSVPAWLATSVCVVVALVWINGNYYAIWALPVLWLATKVDLSVPRSPWAFYTLYPAHMALLAALVLR